MCLCAKGNVLRIDTHQGKKTKPLNKRTAKCSISPLLSSPLQAFPDIKLSLILSTTIGYIFWLLCKLRLWWDCEMSEGTNGRFLTHIQWQASNSWLSLERSSWGWRGLWPQHTVRADTDRNQSHRCEIRQAAGYSSCCVVPFHQWFSKWYMTNQVFQYLYLYFLFLFGRRGNVSCLCIVFLNKCSPSVIRWDILTVC